jgi:type IX secretion system PorP/SprF family membrane protein
MSSKHAKDKRAFVTVLFFFLLINAVKAQQQPFSFSQYMNNLTPLNPAYSLLDKAGSVNTMVRKQWVGIDGGPATFLFNGNLPIQSFNSSAGLIVFNDQFAVEHETEVNAYFAKAVQLGEKDFLAVSINAGVRNYVANYSSLGPSDPEFRNDVRETRPNLGFGLMYYTDWYYLGLSLPELTVTSLGTGSVQNNFNFINHYYFTAALITNVSDDIKFKPATLVSYAKGVPLVADVSGIFYFGEVLGLGADYRTTKEMAGIITVNIDAFQLGYSYQFNTSSANLGAVNNATHEITFSYRFGEGSLKSKLL